MAEKRIRICDRCGAQFEYQKSKWAGYFTRGIKRENHIRFHQMYYGNPDGYSYTDQSYELCAECTKKLIDFLRNK